MDFDDPEESEEKAIPEPFAMTDVIIEAMDRITARAENRHEVTGIRTGYHDLDEIVGGFQKSQLVVIGGRPAMGKTGFALNMCEYMLCEEKKAVFFVSLDMDELELLERMLSSRARVDDFKVRTGKGLDGEDMVRLGRAYTELHKLPLWIASPLSKTMSQIVSDARRLKRRENVDLIVVDDIQGIEPEDPTGSRQEQLARIGRQLKQLARELKVPVLAVSQLGRRGLGPIEGEADVVLLLHRPEYFDPNDQPGIAELIIAKNRRGRTSAVKMNFLKNIIRFENLNQGNESFLNPF